MFGRRRKSIQQKEIQLGFAIIRSIGRSRWEDDFRRMRELRFFVIRVAEFAWSLFELEEGVFRFDFWGRVLDLAHKHGLKVILGTPTPPAWLSCRPNISWC
ncbi:beta-galactosidase [Paenibacillus alkalitolerans]|uniref:beta-galactosidase n=1 Tax=Paenibacillus alkalitolerans TaxID=2799335 RepID=UPI002D7FE0F0|nr:beta-galactosidase [Paenibacillus alkalitolerans]